MMGPWKLTWLVEANQGQPSFDVRGARKGRLPSVRMCLLSNSSGTDALTNLRLNLKMAWLLGSFLVLFFASQSESHVASLSLSLLELFSCVPFLPIAETKHMSGGGARAKRRKETRATRWSEISGLCLRSPSLLHKGFLSVYRLYGLVDK